MTTTATLCFLIGATLFLVGLWIYTGDVSWPGRAARIGQRIGLIGALLILVAVCLSRFSHG